MKSSMLSSTIGIVFVLVFTHLGLTQETAGNAQKIARIQTFIDTHNRSPAALEAKSYLNALIKSDDELVKSRLKAASDDNREQVVAQILSEFPYTPTAKTLQAQRVAQQQQRERQSAGRDFTDLKNMLDTLSTDEVLVKLRDILERDPLEEAQRMLDVFELRHVNEAWASLRDELDLKDPAIVAAKQAEHEEAATERFDYALGLIYDRDLFLRKLMREYPGTQAAAKAEGFLKAENERKRREAEKMRVIREYWDAIYPSRVRAVPESANVRY